MKQRKLVVTLREAKNNRECNSGNAASSKRERAGRKKRKNKVSI